MSNPVLAVSSAAKSYGHVRALRAADLVVDEGHVHALLGQNGAGKSTLIKILNGIEQRDAGEIRVQGEELPSRITPALARSHGLSFIHQDLGLIDEMTVADNMALSLGFPTRAGLVRGNEMRAVAAEHLNALECDIDVDAEVGDLDGAEKAMVALARSLVSGAKLIVLDEPTARLHAHEAAHLFSAVRRLKARGVAFIYVTHRLDEVYQLADRVTVFRDGATVATAAVDETDEDLLVQHIVGRHVSRARVVPAPAATSEPILDVRGLSTSILDNVDLTVARGEILGLTGLVASGATHIGRALFGDVEVRTGAATIRDAVQDWTPRTAMKSGAAYVPADRHQRGLAMELSVQENILGLRYVPKWTTDRRRSGWATLVAGNGERARAAEAAARFQIAAERVDDEVSVLSGGNQQKVLLAKWLMDEPDLIVLEEPTQGVDVGTRAEIYQMIRGLTEAGAAVLLASSDSEEVAQICTRVLVLRDGALAAELVGGDITEDRIASESLRSRGSSANPKPSHDGDRVALGADSATQASPPETPISQAEPPAQPGISRDNDAVRTHPGATNETSEHGSERAEMTNGRAESTTEVAP